MTQKCALLVVTSLGCLTVTVQNEVYAEFDARRLSSHLSSGGVYLKFFVKCDVET